MKIFPSLFLFSSLAWETLVIRPNFRKRAEAEPPVKVLPTGPNSPPPRPKATEFDISTPYTL